MRKNSVCQGAPGVAVAFLLIIAAYSMVVWVFSPFVYYAEVNSTPAKLLAVNKANVQPDEWNVTYKFYVRIVGAKFDLKRYRSENPRCPAYEDLPDEGRNQYVILTNGEPRSVLPYLDRKVTIEKLNWQAPFVSRVR
jgi:hypothetical protein